jgi:membrane-anchored glycerophosphoryl diester phosphodiesterase (GDPDase)
MSKKLPVEAIIRESIRRTSLRYKELIVLCWPYIAVILATYFVQEGTRKDWTSIVNMLAFVVVSVLAAIGCHRVFLVPEEISNLSALRWGKRETQFLINAIGLGFMTALTSIPSMIAVFNIQEMELFSGDENWTLYLLITTLLYAPPYYFIARWALILPASALDRNRNMRWAWDISKGNSFQLFILIGLVPLLTGFVLSSLAEFLGSSIIFLIVQNAIWLAVGAVEICLLSLSYEWMELEMGQSDSS